MDNREPYLSVKNADTLSKIAGNIQALLPDVDVRVEVLPGEFPDECEVLVSLAVIDGTNTTPVYIQQGWFCYLPCTISEVIHRTRDVITDLRMRILVSNTHTVPVVGG